MTVNVTVVLNKVFLQYVINDFNKGFLQYVMRDPIVCLRLYVPVNNFPVILGRPPVKNL